MVSLITILSVAIACSCIMQPPFSQVISEVQSGTRLAIRGRCLSSNSVVNAGSTSTVSVFQVDEVYNTPSTIAVDSQLRVDSGQIGMCGIMFTCDATTSYFVEIYAVASSVNTLSWGTSSCSSTREWDSISASNRAALSAINCPAGSCTMMYTPNVICAAPAAWAYSGPAGYCQQSSGVCSEAQLSCPTDPYATCATCSSSMPCSSGYSCTNGYCLDASGNCPGPYTSAATVTATVTATVPTTVVVCPMIYMPVCGADGNTYGNMCELNAAGVTFLYNGQCGSCSQCGGIAGFACPTGESCMMACPSGMTDCMGVCSGCSSSTIAPPCLCPANYMPVCGVDGITYSNECSLGCAGVKKSIDGECAIEGSNAVALALSSFILA